MKSERRHELEHNVLANWLGGTIEQIKPYASTILLAVLAGLLAVVLVRWWYGNSLAKGASAWDAYYAAFEDPNASEEFDKVAELYPRSKVAEWATVTGADVRLQYGCNQLFTNRSIANQELTKAVNGYLKVLEQASDVTVRERATFGLARAKEAQGDLDEALKSYKEVVKQWPNGAYKQAAQHRIDDLERKSTKEFYDTFAKANPKPPATEGAASGTGPEFNEKSLPEGPAAKSSSPEKSPETSKPADAKK
jgi:tetratricopeptide (TPR) repeat protein